MQNKVRYLTVSVEIKYYRNDERKNSNLVEY